MSSDIVTYDDFLGEYKNADIQRSITGCDRTKVGWALPTL